MKKTKFIATWLVIFGALAFFSAATFETLTGSGAKKAYAATINSDQQLKNADHIAVVNGSTEPGFNGNQMLCSVDTQQFQLLQSQYGGSIAQVTVDGNPVNFVTVPKDGLNRNDIKGVLGDTSHCHVILQNNLFYLLFKGDVS